MVSKTTKSIASRIPLDLYFQLQMEAENLKLNTKDYLLKIILERNEKAKETKIQGDQKSEKEKQPITPKQIKKRVVKNIPAVNEIMFPDV